MQKKLLSALLALCLVLTLLPMATFAAPSSVYVGSVELNNSTPFWRNGEVSASNTAAGFNAYYDAATGTLILRDANVTTACETGYDNNLYGIYAAGDLTLFLEGSNQVGGASLDAAYGNSCGVYAYSMSISGNGSLVTTGGNAAGESDKSCGIYVDTYLLIGGGTVKASSISTIGVAQAMNVQPSYWNGYAFGGYLVKVGADESSAVVIDNPVYGTYTGNKYVSIIPALRASTPSATFSFDGPNAGKLMGTTAQMKHSLDGGNNWVACAAPSTDLSGVLGSISQVNDILIKDMGDGISTFQSLVQTIDITQAAAPTTVGKVDCSTLANNDGKLTGVTTGMEFKLSTAGAWTSGTGSDITGLQSGTYLVRVKATGMVLASTAQSVTINAYVSPAATPSATFSFDGANAGKLMGTTARMKYSLDGGSLWIGCAAPSTDLSGVLGAIGQTMDLRVRDMGDGVNTTGSAVQTIDITKASIPMASKVDCSTLANNDGKLTGVTAAMEYKLFTAGSWTSGTGSDITSLANGTYLVRVKATGTVLASDAQTVVINAYVGTPAVTPSATFSFDGANAGKLMGTTARMKYSLDGGSLWLACAAPSTDLSGVLGAIGQTMDLRVRDMGDGVSTIGSAVQTIDITKASTPTAGKVDCSTLSNRDGKLTGVTAAMEYKLSTDVGWTSGAGSDITGLANGTYLVRVKATGTVLASDAQTVVINAYVGTPATTPSATFSFDGANAGKLMGTTARMKYSLDGGSLWLACAAPSTDLSGVLGAIGQTMDLRVRDMGDDVSTIGSAVQTIDITKASTPTAGKADCTTLANDDGKLTGVTTAMEYRLATDGSWTSGTGSDITDLADGTYQVRVKATGTVLASDTQTVVINAYVGTPATTPSATFSFDGANAGKLMGTTARMKYSLDGGSLWLACAAPSTDLSGVLGAIGQTMDLRVRDMGDGVSTTESQVQTIDITKASTPTAGKVDCSTLATNDGKLTGVTTAMEYRLSPAGSWASGTGNDITGLQSGTYHVRVRATGTALASDVQALTIETYSGTPADEPHASFSFDGSDAGKLLGTTTQMVCSLDGGYNWARCTAPSTNLSGALGSIRTDHDIKIKDLGDGVTTTESAVQTIDITQAEVPTADKVDCTTLANNDGKLTGVTTAMEYKLSTAVTWTSGTGSDITGLANGIYQVRVKATGTVLASDAQNVVISAYVGNPATTPNATFSFDGANAGELLGTTTQMGYSLDGGSTWLACTAQSTNLSDHVSSINEDDDIKVKDIGDGVTTIESAVQTINITRAARPTLVATQPNTIGGNGSISLTTDHEYRLSDAIDWISANGATSLATGNYLVRVKATGIVLASEAQSITLTAFTGNPESTPAAVADYAAEKLTNLTANGSYAVNGTDASADGEGKLTIDSGWLGTTISLVKKGDGVTTNDSEAQSLILAPRPAAPVCTATQPSASAATGTVSGITAEMQYSIDNGISWTDGTGSAVPGLVPGTVLVRVKATGSAPASRNQTLTITAYSAPPSDEGSSGSSGGNGNPIPAPVTEISSGGSTTSSNLSQLISTDKTLTVAGDDGAKLVFDTDALKGITGQASDGIIVELREVSPEHQDNHPGKRVFTLTVSSGGKTISEFGGSVTVTLPYVLKDGESPEDVTVWYLADDGTMTEISCAYDPVTGLANFQVSHFSRYVVGTILDEAVPEEAHFSDVREGDWFHGVVQYVAEKGLMGATSGEAFSPQSNTTRSLLVTILWRLEHEPKAASTAAFSDVLPGESYAEAVAWGAENALVGGCSASHFGPHDNITREQLAVFLYRYAKYKGADVSARGDLSVFKDKPSAWTRVSVQWAVAKGLLRGNGSSDFLDPTGGATRAQLAAVLQRFIETVLK